MTGEPGALVRVPFELTSKTAMTPSQYSGTTRCWPFCANAISQAPLAQFDCWSGRANGSPAMGVIAPVLLLMSKASTLDPV